MRSLVISVLLYASETWTLTADIPRKLQTTEMRCFRKLLGISYRDHITNEAVRDRIRQAIGPCDDILTTVKKRGLGMYQDHHACQDNFTRNGARREKKGPTKEALDRVEVLQRRKRSWKQNQMEGEGCCARGAPTVIDYGIGAGPGAGAVVI